MTDKKREMDCQTRELILQGVLDGEVTPKERGEFLSHLEGCPSCRKEFERSKRIRDLFRKEWELPEGFRENLYARIEEKTGRVGVWPRVAWVGGLATLLLLVSFSLWNRRSAEQSKGVSLSEPSRIHIVTPALGEVMSGEGVDICAAFYPSRREKSSVHLWIDDQEVTEKAEISQDFVLITETLQEGYHRVRVKLEDDKGEVLEEVSWTFYVL